MRLRDFIFLGAAAGTSVALYGALVEAEHLVVERKALRLSGWPTRLDGLKIALLGDFHVQNVRSRNRTRRAVEMAIAESPDIVVLIGDFVGRWKLDNPAMVGDALEPLLAMSGAVVAVPGNHDYHSGDASLLAPILGELDITLLRNEAWSYKGVTWIGVDSANDGRARPEVAQMMARTMPEDDPQIVLWHEPDMVRHLDPGPVLQLSGHSHGGQVRLPGGFTPMHTDNGRQYVRGFYPDAPVPVYVTRGVGTTLMPIRFLCPPEVSILTLRAREASP